MNLSDLTPKAIEDAIAGFYDTLNGHVGNLVMVVAGDRYSIPKRPRRLGAAEFKYYFAGDLDLLFRYALGGVEASRSLILGLCDRIESVLFSSPARPIQPAEVPADFGNTVLGTAIRAARCRVLLRQEDGELRAEDVALLSGLSPQKIAGAKMKGRKAGGKTLYPAAEVRAFFQKEGIRV